MKRAHIIISGKVIGVFFRKFVRVNAEKLNVKGFVKNIEDKVEAVFEGEDRDVDKLSELCKKGPIGAKIEDIMIKEEKYAREFKEFKVRY